MSLQEAISQGNIEEVKRLINAGADVDALDNDGITPLMCAVEEGEIAIVKLLLEKADVNVRSKYGDTALFFAQDVEIAQLLLDKGALVDAQDNSEETPLINALNGNTGEDIAVLLLKYGANFHFFDFEGRTPLMRAVEYDYKDVFRWLLDHGADVNEKGESDDVTALILAAVYGRTEMVKLLLEKGALVNEEDCDGDTALICAIREGNGQIVDLLLDAGAYPNVRVDGLPALIWAFSYDVKLGEKMVEKGANPYWENEDGENAVVLAVKKGLTESVKRMVPAIADVDMCDQEGDTLLMLAVKREYPEIVEWLLQNHASVTLANVKRDRHVDVWDDIDDDPYDDDEDEYTDDEEEDEFYNRSSSVELYTAFDWAIEKENTSILELFIRYGLNPDTWAKLGKRKVPFLVWTVLQGYPKLAEELLRKGASLNISLRDCPELLKKMADRGYVELLEQIDFEQIDADRMSFDLDYLFLWACKNSHIKLAEKFLRCNPSLSDINTLSDTPTPLQYAIQNGCAEIVKGILNHFPHLDTARKDIRLGFLYAADNGYHEVCSLLLQYAIAHTEGPHQQELLFLNAIVSGEMNTVRNLFAMRVNLHAVAFGGMNALMLAVDFNRVETVKLLLQNSVEIDAQNEEGNTALMLATRQGNEQIVDLLLPYEPDGSIQNKSFDTALSLARKRVPVPQWCSLSDVAFITHKMQLAEKLEKWIKENPDFMTAARKGDIKFIVHHLKRGVDVNKRDKDGRTALLWNILYERKDIVHRLLEFGADVRKADNNGTLPLIAAIRTNSINIGWLLKAGADINSCDEDGKTALVCAVKCQNEKALNILLETNVSVNQPDENGLTPLFVAVACENIYAINALLRHGADVHLKDKQGRTFLLCAVRTGNEEIVKRLLDENCDVNEADPYGETPLQVALEQKNIEVVDLLIRNHAELRSPQESALIRAVCAGDIPQVKELLENGAPVNGKDENDLTPLMHAVLIRNVEIVRLLIDYKVDINYGTNNTALAIAAWNGYNEMVELLLENGAHFYKGERNNALERALRNGHTDTAAILEAWPHKIS